MNYEPIIGIEVHVELGTASKMFCGCPADHFGKEPNTQTCPVCLGLPGALPVPNKKAVEWTILLGLALGCTINEESKFDRKHYFYPDLPKGYQISQYDQPLAIGGSLELSNNPIIQSSNNPIKKKIRIRRVHLEEDTGKLQHAVVDGQRVSLVDFNRSGVALVEIVTEPDFRSVEEVDLFTKKLQQIVRYLRISSADMEKGSMRIEPSISMRKVESRKSKVESGEYPNYRVEIKNINSFKFARKAIEYEIIRQTEMLVHGDTPTQQTRGYVEAKGVTVAQREKEEAHDYRYFPEPDIPPMRWESSQLSAISRQIGELPDAKMKRFITAYGLSAYDAGLLVETKERAEYFEQVIRQKSAVISLKTIANWIINKKVDIEKTSPAQLLEQIVESTVVSAITDSEMETIIKQVLLDNVKAAEDYKNGKAQALMFLVGQAMRLAKGKSTAEILKINIIETIKI
ncbi:MAG: Asp-tRNA(Asn)/Glu-tRNA(Gln) amidotransferase subunit GatB [Candidatus Gottesmanbacteria bacterium]|nr:Asp-tRNA(Asn)/Glu-tRNA(Gln) amidotransferase subunit GatB [Candidatus Gottesmanbacteria bacterium]